ncbi:MAG: DUF2861 family protein [Vibrio sp.]
MKYKVSKCCLVTLSLFAAHSWAANDWFLQQNSLTNAHKYLLEGELNQSFSAMVQTWQQEPPEHLQSHLDKLLIKGLDKDCGRSYNDAEFPTWLHNLTIQRQTIQSPGRLSYRLKIDAQSSSQLKDVKFIKWPEQVLLSNSTNLDEKGNPILKSSEEIAPVSTDPVGNATTVGLDPSRVITTQKDSSTSNQNIDEKEWDFNQRIDLNSQLSSGLYQAKLTTTDGKTWETWILIANPINKQTVRWQSKDEWTVDKNGLLNRFCPLPILDIGLYGNVNDDYKEVWQQSYESDYPNALPETDLPASRYLLSVSITHKRWQGAITIEDKQIINKAYDISY